jgi:hypothetical protein
VTAPVQVRGKECGQLTKGVDDRGVLHADHPGGNGAPDVDRGVVHEHASVGRQVQPQRGQPVDLGIRLGDTDLAGEDERIEKGLQRTLGRLGRARSVGQQRGANPAVPEIVQCRE